MEGNKKDIIEKITTGLMIALLFIALFNVIEMAQMNDMPASVTAEATMQTVPTLSSAEVPAPSVDVIPRGVPAVYGDELGVSYDDVSASNAASTNAAIAKLSSLERISLSGAEMQRYIAIGTQIGCEYCCGAEALIFKS